MSKNRWFSILSASTLIVFALSALFTVPALAAGSAIWCPVEVSPVPGSSGCTQPFTNLGGLVSDLGSVAHVPGVIWIKAGTDHSSSNITIDGSGLSNLELQGGWTGTAAGQVSGTSDFSTSIIFKNGINYVTVNDLSFSGASTGLMVFSHGNIHVHDVQSNNSMGLHGTYLFNAFSGAAGGISVDQSTFNNKTAGDGLEAFSNGDISVTDVTASYNSGPGADLGNNFGGTADINVTSGDFNNNTGDGLKAVSAGTISLDKVRANTNRADGADLDNRAGPSSTNMIVSNSTFNSNTNVGLSANSSGVITLNQVGASFNNNGGAYLGAYSALAAAVNVSYSTFNNNSGGYGGYESPGALSISSKGPITVNKVIANSNSSQSAASLNGAGGISVSSSTFNKNTGLWAIATYSVYAAPYQTAVTLSNVTASSNDGDGYDAQGTAATTVNDSSFNGNGTGMDISSDSPITLNNVSASRNQYDGVQAASEVYEEEVSNNIVVSCSNLSYNGDNGIELTYQQGGMLTLNGDTLQGNKLSASLFPAGTVISNPSCQ